MRARLAQAVGSSRVTTTTAGAAATSIGGTSSRRLQHPRPSTTNVQRLRQQRRLILRYATPLMALVGVGFLCIMTLGPQHPPTAELPIRGFHEDRSLMMNPFYGWQPDDHDGDRGDGETCSWRQCFQQDQRSPECRSLCREGDMGPAPPPPLPPAPGSEWIPDVTMLHRMMLDGKDAKGRPWPPALDSELCEDIGAQGGKMDGNKECEYPTPDTHQDVSFILSRRSSLKLP